MLLLVVVAFALLGSPSAVGAGYSTFGTRYYGQGSNGFYQYGSEVTIQVPRVGNHTVADDEFELSRAVVQGALASNTQLVQVGLYRSGASHYLDTCPTSVNAYTYYTEYNYTGQSNGYICHLFGVAPTLEVDSHSVSNYQAAGGGDWFFSISTSGNGLPIAAGTYYVGPTTAIPMYGEEISSPTGVTCQTSQTGGFYGAAVNSFSGWEVYFGANGTSLQPITNQGNTSWAYPTSPLWSEPSLAPWPETISHAPC